MRTLIIDILGDDPTINHLDIWNEAVHYDYPWLQSGTLEP